MSSSTHLLPDHTKYFIADKVDEKYSYDEIVDAVQEKFSRTISKGTITKILNKLEETGSVNNRWNGGSLTSLILKRPER